MRKRDASGPHLHRERTKTSKEAFAAITGDLDAAITAYVESVGAELLPDAPIFRTRGHKPGPKGGRPRAGVPYPTQTLVDDFADSRRLVFGPNETRQLQDIRRSGNVELQIGGASREERGAILANSLAESNFLEETYTPPDRRDGAATGRKARGGRAFIQSEMMKKAERSLNRQSEAVRNHSSKVRKPMKEWRE